MNASKLTFTGGARLVAIYIMNIKKEVSNLIRRASRIEFGRRPTKVEKDKKKDKNKKHCRKWKFR